MAMSKTFSFAGRFLTFRKELLTLWRAFLSAETPMHLKVLMLLVPLYLLSPLDLVPDFIPFLGWVDDFVIVPLLVSWIVSMLPKSAPVHPAGQAGDKVIETTYRRR